MSIVDLTDRDAVHQRVCSLRGQRGELDYEQGRWLLAAYRLSLHDSLGLGSFAEYAERYGGIDARQARERVRVRVAEALESLPLLADALRTSVLGWSAVREITRIAVESTDARWLEAARGRTVREVERMVARHREGDDPFDPPRPEEKRRATFELTAPTGALVKEARESMTAEIGGSVDDDAFLAELARAYLARAGKQDEGRAPYSIAITVCDQCRTATQRAGDGDVVIDAATLEQAQCDAQLLGRVDVPSPAKATQTIPPRIRRNVLRRHGGRCAVPGCCGSAFKELHHTERRADGGDHDPDKLVPLCTRHHAAAHRGALVIRGTYSSGFVFEHADGRPYGAPEAEPGRSTTLATVLELLVAMGWKQREAQAMIDRARPHVGHDASVDVALKTALRHAPVRNAAIAREPAAPYVRLERAKPHVSSDVDLALNAALWRAPARNAAIAREPAAPYVKLERAKPQVSSDVDLAFRTALRHAPVRTAAIARERATPYVKLCVTHVGCDADMELALKAALRHAPVSAAAREPAAPYVKLEPATPHVCSDVDLALKAAIRHAAVRTAAIARERAAPYVRLDRVTHVSSDVDVDLALKAALRHAPVRTAAIAREQRARYLMLAAWTHVAATQMSS